MFAKSLAFTIGKSGLKYMMERWGLSEELRDRR
jgi:hypothetical protein